MKRIAVIFDNLGPYHIFRLNSAAKRCDLLSIEVAGQSSEYAWKRIKDVPFERKTLFAADRKNADDADELLTRIFLAISDHRSEVVVIPGWSGPHAFMGLYAAILRRVPVVLMSESQEEDFERTYLKEWVKRRYVKYCQAGLVGGTMHRSYLANLGMNSERIHLGYDVVDNEYFATYSKKARSDALRLRNVYSLPRDFFLSSARFIPKKNLRFLILAYSIYRRRCIERDGNANLAWDFVLLGDGELRSELHTLVLEHQLQPFVHFLGFRDYEELPNFYGLAGAFVHASTTEQWGLVVNEAMASGLTVLVSDRCGCAPDLVQSGRNGYTFDPHDLQELARLLTHVAGEGCDREAMARAGTEIIEGWTGDVFAEGLLRAARDASGTPRRRLSVVDRTLLWGLGRR